MLEVDDSGWGCPVGGVIIGILRRDSGEYVSGIVPVAYFQGEPFRRGEYLLKARNVAKDLMGRLRLKSREQIIVCPGPFFRELRNYLYEKRMNFRTRTIEGELQRMVERSFARYLNSLRVPEELLEKFNSRMPGKRFYALLSWVGEDYEHRIQLCKTGWTSWPHWEEAIQKARPILEKDQEVT